MHVHPIYRLLDLEKYLDEHHLYRSSQSMIVSFGHSMNFAVVVLLRLYLHLPLVILLVSLLLASLPFLLSGGFDLSSIASFFVVRMFL